MSYAISIKTIFKCFDWNMFLIHLLCNFTTAKFQIGFFIPTLWHKIKNIIRNYK